ncbi:MAG TPA: chemotaxis protein CheW [bacterium]|jgi:purine-binding chemotaxis protein CheW|nr:chemotaxis protein CheW [bacterium]
MSEQFVVFRIGEENYGINISSVLEIIKEAKPTEVPLSSSHVKGVINLRGDIITVIELHQLLNIAERETTDDTRIIVVETEEQKMGVIVDEVIEVTVLSEEDIQPPPKVTSEISRLVEGLAKQDERILMLLNLDSFFELSSAEKLQVG